VPGHDDVGSNEATSGRDETAQERHGDRKWWIGHYPKGSLGQSQVTGIGPYHCHVAVVEAIPQCLRSVAMQFDGNDPSSMVDQRSGERTVPCADIDDEVARADSSVGHNLLGPTPIELMPPPACPFHGHGEPSQRTSWSQSYRVRRTADDGIRR
jgi:hypothetical protein